MGKWAILSVAALLVLGIDAMSGDATRYKIDANDDDYYPSTGKDQQQPGPFAAGHEYTFDYDAQIASGIATTGSIDGQQPMNGAGDEERQMSATRLQCQVKIAFNASSQATLRLQRMRIAQANALAIEDPQRVQPMQLFTARKQLDEQKQRELSLPCAFRYVDGVVLSIQFHEHDSVWSKNVKRAVLNLIQLNLKQKQQQWNLSSEEDEEEQRGKKQQMISKAFTIPETTIEGDCLTTYSINCASQQCVEQEQQSRWNTNDDNKKQLLFNVTKSVDFRRCNAVADIAYGFQSADITPAECQRCQTANYNSGIGINGKPQPSMCSAVCDPKEVKSEQLDRTTVQRFQLAGSPSGKYAIQSAQSVSHYIYRVSNVESDVQQPSVMHTVACAQLTYRGKKSASQSVLESIPKSGKQEILLYDNEWDHTEKEYYMYGDATFNRESERLSPFAHVSKSAAEQAQSIYAKLIHAAADKSHGIESEVAAQLQRLVELLRMCTVQELNVIHNALINAQKQQSASRADAVKVEQLLADTLAMAGTRNTIHVLAEKIQRHQMSSLKAAQTMKNLRSVPAPSDQIAEIVEKLCRSESAERSEPLRQSCWLIYGAIVGQMCSDKKSAKQQQQEEKQQKQLIFGVQSGFDKTQACMSANKQYYKKTLITLYQKADTIYEKVLALKVIGNAGLEELIPELTQIAAVNNEKQERVVPRCIAIDAMRRVSLRQPEQVQRALLPIFQNIEQPTEVRIAAAAMLLRAQPSDTVIDQLAYTLASESDEQVQAFVYSIMQANAQSPIAAQQQLALHLKSALQMAGVEESTLRAATTKQIGGSWATFTTALFSQEQQEGLIGKWMSVFTDRQILPIHLSASVDALFTGQSQKDVLKLSVTQQDTNTWVENLVNAIANSGSYSSSSSGKLRANRAAAMSSSSTDTEIRRIFKGLNVKSRMSSYSNEQPFGMASIRIGDTDLMVMPADRDTIPAPLQQLLTSSGKKLSDNDLSQIQQLAANALAQPIRALHALKLNEKTVKIPMSCGLPLLVSRATSLLSATDIHVKIGNKDDEEEEESSKAHLNAHMIATLSHSQKMECWTPSAATGVQHQHALELNAPLNADIRFQLSTNGGIQKPFVRVAVKVPQAPKTRLFGLHTLPSTYARDFDEKTKMLREPKLRSAAVPNRALNSAMPVQEIDATYGESVFGAPLIRVSGHVHAPRRLTDYSQLAQWCLAAENHIHVTLETAGSAVPREIVFNIKASAFQKMPTGSVKPELDGFYSDAAQFKPVNAEDFKGMELNDNNDRQKNLRNALNKMEQKQQQLFTFYKHELRWSVEAVGGNGQSSSLKAECKLDAVCDAKYKYCKLNANVERNALFADESQSWKLKSKVEMLSPETVSNVQQLEQLADKKNQKFIAQVDTTWGADHQQKINIRIQGEQALNKRQRQSLEQCSENSGCDSRRHQKTMRFAAFCNKFDAAIVYKCHPYTQNYAARILDALKTFNFWSTESQYSSSANQDGELYAGLMIDALAPRYANFSVRTPSQTVMIRNIQLPFSIRPIPLVSGEQKSTHSLAQALQRLTASRRAECSVDGRRVNTFDSMLYKAPITQCYSALAKDCRNVDEPKFAVLMKSLDKDGQQKKVKILTPQQIIECQPASTNAEKLRNADKMIQCRINGEPINIEQEQQQWQSSGLATVEYNNEEQTAVTIYVANDQVAIRFGCQCADCSCQKAWIRLSDAYKNDQCGLCGHFDDTLADEWRMPDNEKANDLTEFHRSYLMQNEEQDEDSKNGECSPAQLQAFYTANQQRFGLIRGFGIKSQTDESPEEQNQDEPEYWKNYNGGYINDGEQSSYESIDEQPQKNWQKSGQKSEKNSRIQDPKLKTKIIEQPHQICFSVKPVKQCLSGTQPIFDQANANDSDYVSDENDEEAPDALKVKFVCISRHLGEARRLQREARRGNGVVSVAQSGYDANIMQKIRQPVKCRRY